MSDYDFDGLGYDRVDSPPPPRQGGYGASPARDRHADWDNGYRHHRERDSRDIREKSYERDRERDRERRHRDDRDRDRGRSERRDRDRDRERRRSSDRSHERERHSHDRDRERRHRHRSPSLSRGRSRERSQSPSRLHSRDQRSKRQSGFDMAPPGAAVVPGAALAGQIAGAVPGVFPGMFPFAGTQFGGIPGMPMQAMTQQATRHARRVYVGGLPPMANEQTIATFFSQVMAAIGGNTAGPGDAVVNVYINHEKKFAFVEMRTVEEASNAMSLDGIIFEGVPVRVRRPSDYNPSLAATLGPSQPSPHLNLAAVGLIPGAVGGADGPDRVFVGGLPYYLTEAQIKELLESFGALRGFDLVKDRETGNSKGYGFCVYHDPAVTDVACAALNGLKMGDKTLTVRRATASGQPKPDQANVLAQAQQHIAMQKLALQVSGANTSALSALPNLLSPGMMPGMPGMANGLSLVDDIPTRVVCLSQVVSPDELKDDEEFEEIYDDMKEECSKYGTVVSLVIPRPKLMGDAIPGVGKVFVEYIDIQGSMKAKASLSGRKFAGNTVIAVYYPEDKFARGDYGGYS
eukprot:c28745_g1_i6 orf=333-2060(+)